EAERDLRDLAAEHASLDDDVRAQAEEQDERRREREAQRAHGPQLGPLGAQQARRGDPRPGEVDGGPGKGCGAHRTASVGEPYSTASRVICMNASSSEMLRVVSSYRVMPRAPAIVPISRAERPWTSRVSRSGVVTVAPSPWSAVARAAASAATTRTEVGATDETTSATVPAASSRPWPMTTRSSAMSESSLMRCDERNTV